MIDFNRNLINLESHSESFMSVRVLLYLSNELGKMDKTTFSNEFNNFNNTGVQMLELYLSYAIKINLKSTFLALRYLNMMLKFHMTFVIHYRPSICPCRIRVENALKTHVIRISFPTRISKIQSKPAFDTR